MHAPSIFARTIQNLKTLRKPCSRLAVEITITLAADADLFHEQEDLLMLTRRKLQYICYALLAVILVPLEQVLRCQVQRKYNKGVPVIQ